MKWTRPYLLGMLATPACLLLAVWAGGAQAQPADLPIPPATTSEYPPGVRVIQTSQGPVYADSRGRTLYGMDMRTLIRWGADPSKYCRDSCAQEWEPLLAPAGAQPNIAFPRGFGERPPGNAPAGRPVQPGPVGPPALPPGFVRPQQAPDWTVIEGAQGPQWVYKGWHVVFSHRNDRRGSTAHDGASDLTWNTLKFVPPVPQIAAPSGVKAAFVGRSYALVDKEGRALFTGNCAAHCGAWTPFTGGLASRGLGEWTVATDGDAPQWRFRGKPVYVSLEDDPTTAPTGGNPIRP